MFNIAIDGPAGAGKSTVAKAVAKHLNILYLDTGAMYRAVALKALRENLNPAVIIDIKSFLSDVKITIKYVSGSQVIFLNGEDVTASIREHSISKAASDISAIPEVRLKLVELQRNIAQNNPLVLDGRDIGTYVLPDAPYKFFLTAGVEERAKRRWKELKDKGQDSDYKIILEDIKNRDYNDSNRSFAPLKIASDAVVIDSSNMTAEEVVNQIIKTVTKRSAE